MPNTHGSPGAAEVDVVSSLADLATLEPCWNALVEQSDSHNVFMTWEWVTTWLEVVAKQKELRVVVVRDPLTRDLVGVVPFVLRRQPWAIPASWKELVLVGSVVTSPDHLDCVAKRGWETTVSKSVLDWLRSPPSGREWDLVRLDGVTPESMLVRGLLGLSPRHSTALWEIASPYVVLPATWEEYEASLAKNFRRNLRRRLRKLEAEANAPVRFETVSTPSRAHEALLDLFRQHEAVRRLGGNTGAFNTALRRRFYQEVVGRFLERGWLRLHRLMAGDRSLATALCFSYGGKIWYYQTGYDPAWHQYGPGYLITRYVIRSAIDEGANEVDMLRGDHSYKYEWNAARRPVLKVRVPSTITGRVVAPAMRWLRAAKHGWKEWRIRR